MSTSKKGFLHNALAKTGPSLKSMVKLALLSRTVRMPRAEGKTLVILANGPSLNDTIASSSEILRSLPTLAVNFAANAPVFFDLRPRYYVMADPVFFGPAEVANLRELRNNLARVDWPMTIFVPRKYVNSLPAEIKANPSVSVAALNNVGVEGWQWLENLAYTRNLGMPRPRNVLIPAIMAAAGMGYTEIYLTGADHSWMKTISVDEENHVISVQPHFYKDGAEEQRRVDTTYRGLRLHDVVHSFYVAFSSYHTLARWAAHRGIRIYNSTPGSFIDAFQRRPLPEKDNQPSHKI